MIRKFWSVGLVMAASLLAGCDNGARSTVKQDKSAPPTTAPATTQPDVAIAPTTEPLTPQIAASYLMIDGKQIQFPVAKLRVSKSNGAVVARLYTDDPKAALEDDYKGNRYDLQLRLDDIREPQQVYTSQWQFKAHSREYVDAPYGIFLEGMKHQLQPFNASARILGDMLMVRIDLEGEFLSFDLSDPSGAPRTVYVKGSLMAPIEYKD